MIVVTGIYTENYRSVVELQEQSCLDDYVFDYRYITDEEWNKHKSQDGFAFFGGNTIKTQLVIDKIKEYWGKLIIVADADLVFLKKTEDRLLQELGDKDMLFLRERYDFEKNPYEKARANINIGFVLMRCNERSLAFWEIVQEQVVNLAGWDQEIANEIMLNKEIDLKYALLSENFLNGGDINSKNIRQQYICTSCGTVAKRNNLSKYEYLSKVLEIAQGKNNVWFDGNLVEPSSLKKVTLVDKIKKLIKL